MMFVFQDPDVFPEDCMHFMESIDSLSLSDFRPGAMIEVMIGEVYSPSHFWFIRLGDNYNVAMEDMMDEMRFVWTCTVICFSCSGICFWCPKLSEIIMCK